jgi:hypothetical protein
VTAIERLPDGTLVRRPPDPFSAGELARRHSVSAQVRTALLGEPRPAGADDVRVGLVGRRWFTCWILDGRKSVPFGPGFDHVAEASAAARLVREAHGLT